MVFPVDVRHAAHHQHRHVDQRACGGVGGNHAGQRSEEHRGEEQHADGDGGQAGTAAGSDTGNAFHIAGHRWAANHRTDHAGGGVGFQRLGQVLDLAVFIHQVGAVGDAHQGAGGVEHVHEEEGQDHADHCHVERAGNVHGQEGRCQARRHRHQAAIFHQAQGPADGGYTEHAEEDGAEHVAVAEHGDQQEAYGGQQRRRVGERAHGQQGGRAVDDDAGSLQTDQAEEQADPGAHGEAQAHRDAVEQPFADFRQAHDHEQHAGDEHGAEGDLPAITHFTDDGVGEEGVQAHARCQADRPVGVQPHQEAAQRRTDAGGDECGAVIDAGGGHDVGVDENDVGHGDEGRQTGQQFGLEGGAVLGQFEEAVEQTSSCQLSRVLFLFDAFHCGYSSCLLLCTAQSVAQGQCSLR